MGNKIKGLYTQAKSAEDYLNQRLDKSGGCWLWTSSVDKDGYGQVHCSKYGKELKCSRAHQMAYLTWAGDYNRSLFICHTCHTPRCCNPAHLYAGTGKDNYRDMKEAGRVVNKRGQDNPISKLTNKQAQLIKNSRGKYTCFELAERFGVSFGHICRIWRNERYKDVK